MSFVLGSLSNAYRNAQIRKYGRVVRDPELNSPSALRSSYPAQAAAQAIARLALHMPLSRQSNPATPPGVSATPNAPANPTDSTDPNDPNAAFRARQIALNTKRPQRASLRKRGLDPDVMLGLDAHNALIFNTQPR